MAQPLPIDRLRQWRIAPARSQYGRDDTIIYALGVGAGLSDWPEEQFVYEDGLAALPSMALTLGTPGFWAMDPALGLDWPMILHGEQSLRMHRPLPPAGDVTGQTEIGAIADKGTGRAALLQSTHKLFDTASGAPVATMEAVWVLRGAGGFGGADVAVGPALTTMPTRAADLEVTLPTSPQQAMLYRLTGDRNPLHILPAIARQAGFERPILHGLSTFGVIARALIHGCCAGNAERLQAMRLRFSAPVYPGDVLTTRIWRQASNQLSFQTICQARDVIVADGGDAELTS
ncbi:MAG: MaoC/PaaZ C-terminal domain-containing protein [Sphingomonadales bacterium]